METDHPSQSWLSLLQTVRAPTALVCGIALALLVPAQTEDIISGLWEGRQLWHGDIVTLHVLLALFGLSAWHWARAALAARNSTGDTRCSRASLSDGRRAMDPEAFVLLPRLLYVATMAVGFGITVRSVGTRPDGGWWWTVPSYAAIVGIWICGLLLLIWRLPLQKALTGREDQTAADRCPGWMQRMPGALHTLLRYAPFGPVFATCLLALAAISFAAGVFGTLFNIDGTRVAFPVALGRMFPGPGAVLLALAVALGPLAVLTFAVDGISRSWRIWGLTVRARWTPVLLILVFFMAYVPTEVHLHQVRIIDSPRAMRPAQRRHLSDLLEAWAAACPGDGPLRPVIVALSGGASRAGLWGARVLTKVDTAAREGGTGIFAISSVSGGSLGAAGYMTWRAAQPKGPPCGGTAVSPPDAPLILAMRGDALGPLLAGALFGDATRSLAGTLLLPAAWVGVEARLPRGGDRAAALERAFEANWREAFATVSVVGGGIPGLDRPYLELVYARDGGHSPIGTVPLWLANGTDQQNGERLMTVPFSPSLTRTSSSGTPETGWPFDGAKDVLALVGADMPVSAVIDNTARFPLLSPIGELAPARAALVGGPSARPTQIFDGGYFDNGGLQTAVELANWLESQHLLSKRQVKPVIVQASADADGVPEEVDPGLPRCGAVFHDDIAESAGSRADDQLSAPVRGLDGVRRGHAQLVLRQVLRRYCPEPQRFFHFYLYRDRDHSVPLNWSLSKSVADFIWDGMATTSNDAELQRLKATLATGAGSAIAGKQEGQQR
jgi:hypothetical protein